MYLPFSGIVFLFQTFRILRDHWASMFPYSCLTPMSRSKVTLRISAVAFQTFILVGSWQQINLFLRRLCGGTNESVRSFEYSTQGP